MMASDSVEAHQPVPVRGSQVLPPLVKEGIALPSSWVTWGTENGNNTRNDVTTSISQPY